MDLLTLDHSQVHEKLMLGQYCHNINVQDKLLRTASKVPLVILFIMIGELLFRQINHQMMINGEK